VEVGEEAGTAAEGMLATGAGKLSGPRCPQPAKTKLSTRRLADATTSRVPIPVEPALSLATLRLTAFIERFYRP
jgi:hypothetical protein